MKKQQDNFVDNGVNIESVDVQNFSSPSFNFDDNGSSRINMLEENDRFQIVYTWSPEQNIPTNYQDNVPFYVALQPVVIEAISCVFYRAGSSSPNLTVRKAISGETISTSSTALTTSPFTLGSAAFTPQFRTLQDGGLVSELSIRMLNKGDMVGYSIDNSVTNLIGLTVVLYLRYLHRAKI